MLVPPRVHSLPPTLQIYCGDRALDIVSSYKYLGVYIDNGLTWKEHIDHVIRKSVAKNLCRAHFRTTIDTDLPADLLLVGDTARPGVWLHCLQFQPFNISGKDRLLQASKKGLRAIVRAPPWTPTAPTLQPPAAPGFNCQAV